MFVDVHYTYYDNNNNNNKKSMYRMIIYLKIFKNSEK